jgi:hypothetical protein
MQDPRVLAALPLDLDTLDASVRERDDPVVAGAHPLVHVDLLGVVVLEDRVLAVAVVLDRVVVEPDRGLRVAGLVGLSRDRLLVRGFLEVDPRDHPIGLGLRWEAALVVLEVLLPAGGLDHVVEHPLLAVAGAVHVHRGVTVAEHQRPPWFVDRSVIGSACGTTDSVRVARRPFETRATAARRVSAGRTFGGRARRTRAA